MIEIILKFLFFITAIIGWMFFITSIYIFIRWNNFVNRNPNAQDIINAIILRVIFAD